MPPLEILHYPDPVLLTVADPVLPHEYGSELDALIEDMFETMDLAGGVGLAAPQIGISKRLFVMDVRSDPDQPNRQVLINPEIIHFEGEQSGDEGCLSFPGLFQPVVRQSRVIARANDSKGGMVEFDESALAARCILHETDHCDGIVFLDRMTPLKRELAKRRIRRLQRSGEWG